MSYSEFLFLWKDRLKIQDNASYDSLKNPDAEKLYNYACSVMDHISEKTGHSLDLGGSLLYVDGKSALGRGRKIDCDLRLWIENDEELARVEKRVCNCFPVSEKRDKSAQPDILRTGVGAYLLVWKDTCDEYDIDIELLIRRAPEEGYTSLARKRLEQISKEELAGYIELKNAAKKIDDTTYRAFKSEEKQFWILEKKLIEAINTIHDETVGDRKRHSSNTHAAHMKKVAYKTLAMGGNRREFIAAYLHDCIEESGKSIDGYNTIIQYLAPVTGRGEAEAIADTVALVTENGVDEEEFITKKEEINQSLTALADTLGNRLNESDKTEYSRYVYTYRRFIGKLAVNKDRVSRIETADRWDGLEHLEYLKELPPFKCYLSCIRDYSILSAMDAPQCIKNMVYEKAEELELKPDIIIGNAGILMPD